MDFAYLFLRGLTSIFYFILQLFGSSLAPASEGDEAPDGADETPENPELPIVITF